MLGLVPGSVTRARVVHQVPPHTHSDEVVGMEKVVKKIGNTTVIIVPPPPVTPEEKKRIDEEIHQAAWAIVEEMLEKVKEG